MPGFRIKHGNDGADMKYVGNFRFVNYKFENNGDNDSKSFNVNYDNYSGITDADFVHVENNYYKIKIENEYFKSVGHWIRPTTNTEDASLYEIVQNTDIMEYSRIAGTTRHVVTDIWYIKDKSSGKWLCMDYYG